MNRLLALIEPAVASKSRHHEQGSYNTCTYTVRHRLEFLSRLAVRFTSRNRTSGITMSQRLELS